MSVFTIPEVWMDRVVRILLVGAGGTGSQLCDQLASLEVTLRRLGHPGFDVKVLDADEVSASNVGRQRYTEADIGSPKAALMVHRINLFYGLDWEARVERYDPTAYHLGYDLIVTAVDKAAFRAAMGRRHQDADGETLWLDTGNGATSGNVVIGHLAKPRRGQRLPNVFDLFPELAGMTATDAEQPSCSTEEAIARQEWPVNRCAAQIATELLWTLFRHGRITTHGAFFQLNPMRVQPLAIDPEAWRFLGYEDPSLPKESAPMRKRKRAA
jgi:PRTRC genetic system ThiF family protein